MEKLMKFGAKFCVVLLFMIMTPFVIAYAGGLITDKFDFWSQVKIARILVLALIIFVPILMQHWRENQKFFLKWVSFLLIYVIVTTILWAKGF